MKNRPYLNVAPFIDELRYVSSKFYQDLNPCNVFSSIFSAHDVKLVREHAANQNLVVTQPDDGNGVVILIEAYIDSMEG